MNTRKRIGLWWLLTILCFGGLAVAPQGCGTLDPQGVYQADKVVYSAELTIVTSQEIAGSFLKWERDNRVLLNNPDLKKFADKVRVEGKKALQSAIAANEAYKVAKTPEHATALEATLAVVRSLMKEAQLWMAKSATL